MDEIDSWRSATYTWLLTYYKQETKKKIHKMAGKNLEKEKIETAIKRRARLVNGMADKQKVKHIGKIKTWMHWR